MRIEIRVLGEPKGQPRPRGVAYFSKSKQRQSARVYNPGTAEGWKAQIAAEIRGQLPEVPYDGPISLAARFLMPRPKRLMRKKDPECEVPHLATPDCDNLIKAVLDICTQLSVWNDDKQVVDLFVQKRYTQKIGRPGMHLIIESMEDV